MQEVLAEFYSQFDYLQRKIASRELRDTTRDIYGRFLEEEGFSPVYSDLVLFVGKSDDEGLAAAGVSSEVPQFQMSSGALSLHSLQKAALPYLHAPGSRVCMPPVHVAACMPVQSARNMEVSCGGPCEMLFQSWHVVQDNVKPVTIWLVVDLSRPEAAGLVCSAARFISAHDADMTRLSLLFNGVPEASGGQNEYLARFLVATMSLSSRVDKISPFLRSLSGGDLWEQLAGGGQAALDAAVAAAEEAGLNGVALKRALGDEGCCSPAGTQVAPCRCATQAFPVTDHTESYGPT